MSLFAKCLPVLICICSSVLAQNSSRVYDLKDREFTADEVKRALIVPKVNPSAGTSNSDRTTSPAKSRKTRGLGVVAADSSSVEESTPPPLSPPAPAPKLSMQLPFAFDSAEITESARTRLDALGAALQSPELVQERYVVSGHTDATGRYAYNMALSKRRAESVKGYLVAKHGVSPERIVPVGRGSDDLMDPTDPRAAANRRVMIEGIR